MQDSGEETDCEGCNVITVQVGVSRVPEICAEQEDEHSRQKAGGHENQSNTVDKLKKYQRG